ncbi:MAG: hypothetical protein E7430_04690 [Ruminococcaceae bacterium]|nr:hypothetical protein [Oscillospiraceae bacterium]
MRKVLSFALMMTLLFSACKTAANDPGQAALDIRTRLLTAGEISLCADVQADYGERVYDYRLECDYVCKGDSSVTVIEPDIISGISATVSRSGTSLSFDGVSLDTGSLEGTELSPLGALPAMADAWCSGYISNTCAAQLNGTDCYFVSYLTGSGSDELEIRTWFDKSTLLPVYGEIVSGGSVVIYAGFTQ